MKITPEHLQQELEVIGRLLTETKAEVGSLRDEVRALAASNNGMSARQDRLVDKLIEMALVNQGQFKEAAVKSRLTALDPATTFGNGNEQDDMYTEEGSETEWTSIP